MTYRKTWLSYILWALFTCLAGAMLAAYGTLFWQQIIGYEISYYLIIFLIMLLLLILCCYVLIRKVLMPFAYRHRISTHKSRLWENIIACALVLAGILYRIGLCMESSADRIVETEVYQNAVVGAGEYIEPIRHKFSFLYMICLSGCMSFLGNKPVVGVWLQIVIQSATLVLSYVLIKKIAGRIPALALLLVLGFSPAYVEEIFILTPECLFLLIYLISIYVTVGYVKDYCYREGGKAARIAAVLFAGIMIGILGYIDPVMFTLVVFLSGIITGKDCRRKNSVFLFVLSIVMVVLVFVGILTVDAYLWGREISESAAAWGNNINYGSFALNAFVMPYMESFFWEGFLLVIISALLIMSFWNRRKLQNCTPWIALLLFMMTGISPYQLQFLFIWSILAGIGLQQCFEPERSKAVLKILEDGKQIEAEETVAEQTVFEQTETTVLETEVKKVSMPVAKKKLKPEESEKTETVKLIENPLPLPKRHEKREMDYQYQVTEDKMKFDVEISDRDDFDI